jgi:hypothetical protein
MMANIKGIQKGANTHHQDHAITLVSFRTIKINRSTLVKPRPELVVSFFMMIML